jgi:hypothetical protein
MGQAHGNTVGAYIMGADSYSAGQFLHFGIDLSMPCGTPLLAVATGEVSGVDDMSRGSAPHNLLLRFPDLGLVVLYGHLLERPTLVVGQIVQQGEVVALSGSPTGDCDFRPHLHLEVRALNHAAAYNPIDYIQGAWHSWSGLGIRSGALFQRDLYNPRRWMSLNDQPDIRFGGTRLNNYRLTSPSTADRNMIRTAALPQAYTPPAPNWGLRAVPGFEGACCAGPWWRMESSDNFYVIDGPEGQLANLYAVDTSGALPPQIVQAAPAPYFSADGSHQLIYEGDITRIVRLADGQQWQFIFPNSYPGLSPDNTHLLWRINDREVWAGALDGSSSTRLWVGESVAAQWLDSERILIRQAEEGRFSSYHVVKLSDGASYSLGTWHNLRAERVAPGGKQLIFLTSFNQDPALDGLYLLPLEAGGVAQKLPWLGDYRWRDSESLFYLSYDPFTDTQGLHFYHPASGQDTPLTERGRQVFSIANGDWAVSPDGQKIVFQSALDGRLWLLEGLPEG